MGAMAISCDPSAVTSEGAVAVVHEERSVVLTSAQVYTCEQPLSRSRLSGSAGGAACRADPAMHKERE